MQLVLEDVCYSYGSADGGFSLSDISLTVNQGDFIGIIGHSGSGKSTLIQLMAALIQPTSGRVLLGSDDLSQSSKRLGLFTKVGIAFQYPEAQLFAPTVYQDIAFAARNAKLPDSEVDSQVRYWMSALGLDFESEAERSPFELSGGEQRRAALAGILVVEPELLILDEPTAGLDPQGRENLLSVIRDYHAAGHSIVMVSHSMDDVAEVANRIVVLKDGREFLQGTPAEVFLHAGELRRINLDVPAAEGFAGELRQAGINLPGPLLDVDSLADAIVEAIHQARGQDAG